MAPDTYHHGDLPTALRSSAVQLLAERGPGGFSLREVARRAGVSHAAPAHHYGDATGLLTAVAAEAFQHLYERLSAATDDVDDPIERLLRLGRAYVETASAHPGHCAVMFRNDLIHDDHPSVAEWSSRAYDVLRDCVRGVVDTPGSGPNAGAVDVDVPSRVCWAAMQGLVDLHRSFEHLDARDGRVTPAMGDLAEAFTAVIVDGLDGARPRS